CRGCVSTSPNNTSDVSVLAAIVSLSKNRNDSPIAPKQEPIKRSLVAIFLSSATRSRTRRDSDDDKSLSNSYVSSYDAKKRLTLGSRTDLVDSFSSINVARSTSLAPVANSILPPQISLNTIVSVSKLASSISSKAFYLFARGSVGLKIVTS